MPEAKPKRARIAIIGAGIGGLTAAWALRAEADVDVVMYEASSRPGGVIHTSRAAGYLREHAVNGFLSTPGGAMDLARELGLEVVAASPAARKRWIYRRGALRALPGSPLALIKNDLVSWRGKLAALAEPLRPAQAGRTSPEHDETVLEFARRRLGAEVAEAVVAPFVTGVFAGRAAELSVKAAFPALVDLEQHGGLVRGMVHRQVTKMTSRVRARLARPQAASHASTAASAAPEPRRKRPRISAPAGGMEALIQALAADLGQALRLDTAVAALVPTEHGVRIELASGAAEEAHAVVLATPAYVSARLVQGAAPELAAVLDEIPYAPAAVVHLGFERAAIAHPLDGFGFLVAEGEDVRVLGTVFESILWPDRAPAGQVLLRCIYGGTRDPGIVELDEDELVAVARRDLERVLGIQAAPVHANVVRWPRAIPQYTLGHLARLERAEALARPRGLILAGNPYRSVAVNGIVADARRVASAVFSRLQSGLGGAGLASFVGFMGILSFLALGLAACASGSQTGGNERSDRAAAVGAGEQAAAPQVAQARPQNGQDSGPGEPLGAGDVDSETRAAGAARPRDADAGGMSITVIWPDVPPALRQSPGRNACGVARRPPVSVHTLGGVQGVVVGVRNLAGHAADSQAPGAAAGHGAGQEAEASPVPVIVHECQASPRVVVMPRLDSDSRLAIVNHDEQRHQLRLEQREPFWQAPGASKPASSKPASIKPASTRELALPVVGSRVELSMTKPIMLAITGTPEPAYVFAAAEPHVAVTDEEGAVSFASLPAGTYELWAWHPPVTAGSMPLEARQSVTIEAGKTATVALALATP